MIGIKKSLPIKLFAVLLAISLAVGSVPTAVLLFPVKAETSVAKIGDTEYETLKQAVDAATSGANRVAAEKTVITLISDTQCSFDVGKSDGSVTKNIELDLGGHTLSLGPAVGSTGTETNGIRVLAFSKMHIKNGTLVCLDDDALRVKVGIANYGELELEDVELKSGALTLYTINNRGKLTLSGKTKVETGKALVSGAKDYIAITLDPYDLYYTENVDASLICDSEDVVVGNVQIERYARTSKNKGDVVLDISAGSFERIFEDGNNSVGVKYDLDGGVYGAYTDEEFNYLADKAKEEKQITVKLCGDGEFEKGFDIGENKSIVLDLGGKALSLASASNTGAVVRKNGKLHVKNGTLLCVTKFGIENNGEIKLENVIVTAEGDNKTLYPINNKGKLTLLGNTEIRNAKYYSNNYAVDVDSANDTAVVECDSENVTVGNLLLENSGKTENSVDLKISNGTFGKIVRDGETKAGKTVTGGKFGTDVSEYTDTDVYGVTFDKDTELYSVKALIESDEFKFTYENPDGLLVGQKLTNTAGTAGMIVKYEITEQKNESGENADGIAEINGDTGEIEFKKAGSVTVKATIVNTNVYKPAEASYTISAKRNESELTFKEPNPEKTYEKDLTYSNSFLTEVGEGKITYEITSGNDCAEIDAETGLVTVKKAGVITVKATKEGSDAYDGCEDEYTLTVTLGAADFKVDDINLKYGVTEWQVDVDEDLGTKGKYHFSVSDNDIGVTIDENGKLAFVDSDGKVGSVTITVTREADECYEENEKTVTLTVSYLEVTEEEKNSILNQVSSEWYTAPVTVYPPDGMEISKSNTLADNEWGESVTHNWTGVTSLTVYLEKDGGISDAITIDDIKIDLTPPKITISYSTPSVFETIIETLTFGYYKSSVKVTLTATDMQSGIKSINYWILSDTGETIIEGVTTVDERELTIDAPAKCYVKAYATNNAGLRSDETVESHIIVVDDICPEISVGYSEAIEKSYDDKILYYNADAEATLTVKEANFYGQDVKVKLDGESVDVTWQSGESDTYTATVAISGDGDHRLTVEYTDRSGNEAVSYTSPEIRIDETAPVISVELDGEESSTNKGYYKSCHAVITVTEHNFDENNVKLTVSAKDRAGKAITVPASTLVWTSDGDTHKATVELDTEAEYTLDVDCSDIVGNAAQTYTTETFTVDKTAPGEVGIEYSTPVIGKLLETVSFGFYKSSVTVTLTASDNLSGVDCFEWSFGEAKNGKINADSISYDANGRATASFTVDVQARGFIKAKATDKVGNSAEKSDEGVNTVVIDNISPIVNVEYKAVNANTKTRFTNGTGDVNSLNEATQVYYNGKVKAVIKVIETNFFEGVTAGDGVIHDFGIKVTKTDNGGGKTVYEYLPTGSEGKYPGAVKKYFSWQGNTAEVIFDGDGDYVLELEYGDLSGNKANPYKSKIFTVDTTAPTISVSYGNNKPIAEADGRKYFDKEQSVSITVKEHNFRASEFVATVTAKDVLGNDVTISDFKSYMANKNNWTKNGDEYTLTAKFSVDANYTFTCAYTDLARNEANKYGEEKFTVDTTPPEKLTITYSNSITSRVLEAITFGYYNAPVTVTVSAEDKTTGVCRFEYSYKNSNGVSDVNGEILNAAIKEADITADGKTYSASFTVPKDTLKDGTQFNGTVSFKAFDKAENDSEKTDKYRVVVDNIAPTVSVEYTKPSNTNDGVAYYSSDIDVKVVINEANFYGQDVVVKVNGEKTDVKWEDAEGDVHNGTFKLTADGDYTVSVDYTDRSDNKMTSYTSNKMTIDTVKPIIKVSGLKNNSANKSDKIVVTVVSEDANMDTDAFNASLTAVVADENGNAEKKSVPFGKVKCTEKGKRYELTTENIEWDGVYTLTCTVKDLALNTCSVIVLDDGEEYEKVDFSVNRKGSSFTADENTGKMLEQYYVQSVGENIVVEEVNTDTVNTYVVKLNGKELNEGEDYTTSSAQNENEWAKRTYVISKQLFDGEGEYRITVESTDKAGTQAYSDVKGLSVAFTVDKTAPTVTVSGLENGGRYRAGEQTAVAIPSDDGGRLYSFKAVVLDRGGNEIKVGFEKSGDELLNYLSENGGKITFSVPEGLENRVRIICTDSAGNEYNNEYTKVTVSQSSWVIYYANKPLFYGSIAGGVAVIAAIVIFIASKKKKKKTA